MYIAKLSLWNFRKFGIPEYTIDINSPHLEVEFKPIMNVLIGENDSGKTAIRHFCPCSIQMQMKRFSETIFPVSTISY